MSDTFRRSSLNGWIAGNNDAPDFLVGSAILNALLW